jgi:GNAT superfamily N-acetyltransferase
LGQLGYSTDLGFLRERLKKLRSRFDIVLVAVSGKKIMGFTSLHLMPLIHENGYICRITALVVDRDSRRKGVGMALVRKAETYAVKKGAVKVEITSADRRKEAHAFYLRLGYREYRKRFLKKLNL